MYSCSEQRATGTSSACSGLCIPWTKNFIWLVIFSHLILVPSSEQQLSLWEAELMHLEYLNLLASVVVLIP